MTLAERLEAAKAKPENERTDEEKLMLKAIQEAQERAIRNLKGE